MTVEYSTKLFFSFFSSKKSGFLRWISDLQISLVTIRFTCNTLQNYLKSLGGVTNIIFGGFRNFYDIRIFYKICFSHLFRQNVSFQDGNLFISLITARFACNKLHFFGKSLGVLIAKFFMTVEISMVEEYSTKFVFSSFSPNFEVF